MPQIIFSKLIFILYIINIFFCGGAYAAREKITIGWISGHTGVRGNEIADKLTKQGAATPFEGAEPGMGITHSFLKRHLKSIVTEETNKYWINLPKDSQNYFLECRTKVDKLFAVS